MLWIARLVQIKGSVCRRNGCARVYELFRSSSGLVYLFPGQGEPFVEPELFKHLVALFATKGTTFDQPVDSPMGEPISVPFVVEP
jgi:hypothetical protein